jgi:hypothetical protein
MTAGPASRGQERPTEPTERAVARPRLGSIRCDDLLDAQLRGLTSYLSLYDGEVARR